MERGRRPDPFGLRRGIAGVDSKYSILGKNENLSEDNGIGRSQKPEGSDILEEDQGTVIRIGEPFSEHFPRTVLIKMKLRPDEIKIMRVHRRVKPSLQK